MSNNRIAQAIEDAYIKNYKKRFFTEDEHVNPVDCMANDTGIELAYLFLNEKNNCDPMTDWTTRIFGFEWLMKDLLVLIGKPGILNTLQESTRGSASFQLMRLLEFFQALNEKETTKDWLTWTMLDQFKVDGDHTLQDEKIILRNLKVKP